MAQTPVKHYMQLPMERIQKGGTDSSFIITHRAFAADGPDLSTNFGDKQDGCVKVVLPTTDPTIL